VPGASGKIRRSFFSGNAKMSNELTIKACELFPARRTSLFEPGLRGMGRGMGVLRPLSKYKIAEEYEWNSAP